MFANLDRAIKAEMEHRDKTNAANAYVLSTIPEEPERGSYYWWARLCRQNTGQHFLDSGIAYGYNYNRPILPEEYDPVTMQFYDGVFEYARVHLPAYLCAMFDAADETATALEKRLYEIAETMPRESWYDVVQAFLDAGDYKTEGGDNTYNYDNDLDQDFQTEVILVADDDTRYCVLRIHTGCDIRGGYTSPVIVAVRDDDYAYTGMRVEFDCECGAFYEDSYEYHRAVEKLDEKPQQYALILESDLPRNPREDGFDAAPAGMTALWCPDCGKYTVRAFSIVHGF